MSELTTEQALGFIADGLCDCMGTFEEHHTDGCPQDNEARAWLAQVQREAAEPHLRRKWADEARKLLNMRADFQGPHATARNRGIHDVISLLEGAGE